MSWRTLVWQTVGRFRATYPCEELETLPVDTIALADIVLRLDVIPFDDLRAKYDKEAALTADFTGIYVDGEIYDVIDHGKGWKFNHLRFSVAHEIGHWFLHKDEFQREGFKELGEFYDWTASLGGRKSDIEKEADEFAGRLLVPRDRLESDLHRLDQTFDAHYPHWRGDPAIRRGVAESLGEKYGVPSEIILARFTREDLWPALNGD